MHRESLVRLGLRKTRRSSTCVVLRGNRARWLLECGGEESPSRCRATRYRRSIVAMGSRSDRAPTLFFRGIGKRNSGSPAREGARRRCSLVASMLGKRAEGSMCWRNDWREPMLWVQRLLARRSLGCMRLRRCAFGRDGDWFGPVSPRTEPHYRPRRAASQCAVAIGRGD